MRQVIGLGSGSMATTMVVHSKKALTFFLLIRYRSNHDKYSDFATDLKPGGYETQHSGGYGVYGNLSVDVSCTCSPLWVLCQ